MGHDNTLLWGISDIYYVLWTFKPILVAVKWSSKFMSLHDCILTLLDVVQEWVHDSTYFTFGETTHHTYLELLCSYFFLSFTRGSRSLKVVIIACAISNGERMKSVTRMKRLMRQNVEFKIRTQTISMTWARYENQSTDHIGYVAKSFTYGSLVQRHRRSQILR